MDRSVKILLILGIGGILLSSFGKAAKFASFAKNVIVETAYKVMFQAGTLTMQVTPTIKNPSAQSLQIRHPFVSLKITPDGDPVASSQVSDQLYTIEPFKQITLNPLIISMSAFQLGQLLLQLGKDLFNSGKVSLYVDTIVGFSSDVPPFVKSETYEIDPRNLF